MHPAKKLRELLTSKHTLLAPGVFDGLSAKLASQAGFELLYASGGAIARSTGVPDIGLLTLTEVTERLTQITAQTTLPIIADADTGYGNEINVARTVQLFEQAKVAGFHLEDQQFPKRCGHLDGKALVSTEEMAIKLQAAINARQVANTVIIARTDAIAVEGFDQALERAKAYQAAGADMIFVEAPTSREQIETIAKTLTGPKLINMFSGGKTPLIPLEDLRAMGYQVVIVPSDLQRAAIFGMQQALQVLLRDGSCEANLDVMATFKEREDIVGTKGYF